MGRSLLLSVALATLGVVLVRHNSSDGQSRATERVALDQRYVLAQRGAGGGMDAAISRLSRGYSTWRDGYPETQAGDLSFSVQPEGPLAGPVRLTALGTYGEARHRIEVIVSRLANGPAALVLDADDVDATFTGNQWLLSGSDAAARSWLQTTTPVEGTGQGRTTRALRTRSAGATDAVRAASAGRGKRIRGLAAADDIEEAWSPELTSLASEVELIARTLHTLADPHVFSSYVGGAGATLGSPSEPTAVHVTGDFTSVSGAFRGFGVLLVDGDFRVGSGFEWNGVVIVRGENETDVSLSGQAAVYGGLYVLHEAGYELGDGFYPYKSVWAVDDADARLLYFNVKEDTVIVNVEGALSGMDLDMAGEDRVDVEGFAFMPDGTAYLVNNRGARRSIHRIDPDQFDNDPATPVEAAFVGSTGIGPQADRVTGMVVKNGVLYGMSRYSRKLYRINTSTGAATYLRSFSADMASPRFAAGGLSMGPEGAVFTARVNDSNDLELWRFDSFPSGDPTHVGPLGPRPPTTSFMGAPLAGAPDGTLFLTDRTEVRTSSPAGGLESILDLALDIDAMEMFWEGEGGLSGGAAPGFHTVSRFDGLGSSSATIPWSAGPDVSVAWSVARASGSGGAGAYFGGSDLEEFTSGRTVGGSGATEPGGPSLQYTGPAFLPLLRYSPGETASGEAMAFSIEFSFSQAWSRPFYLHLLDLDKHPVYLSARDAAGNPVSTVAWTKDADMDIVGDVDMGPYAWSPDGSWANASWPTGAGRLQHTTTVDKETGFVSIRVPGVGVRSLRVETRTGGNDSQAITISTEPMFEPPSTDLTFSMSGSARVVHSAQAIGLLAALVPSVEDRSFLVSHDRFGRDLPPGAPAPPASGPPSQATSPGNP